MIAYYKYTGGSEFTYEDGTPYVGIINVTSGDVYTGPYYTVSSKKLVSTDNILAKCIVNELNFNYTTLSKVADTLEKIDIYPRSILTPDLIADTIDTLSTNNAKLFASSVRVNKNFFNQNLRDSSDTVYSTRLTSYDGSFVSIKNVDINPTLTFNAIIPQSPLSGSNLQDIVNAITANTSSRNSFVISENLSSFNYYKGFGLVKGQANSSKPHTFYNSFAEIPFETFDHNFVYYNKYTNKVYQTSRNSALTILNVDYTNGLPSLIVNDVLNITNVNRPLSRYTAAYGRSFRSVIATSGGLHSIEIYALNSTQQLSVSYAEDYGFDSNGIDGVYQRFEDDIIVITGSVRGQSAVKVYDLEELLSGDGTSVAEHVFDDVLPTFIEFADFDSDLMFFKYYNDVFGLEKVEVRSITSPSNILAVYTYDSFKYNNFNDAISDSESSLNPIDEIAVILAPLSVPDYIIDIRHITTDKIITISVLQDSITYDNYNPYEYIVTPSLRALPKKVDSSLEVSSIGLSINTKLQQIIEDILLLYYNFSGRYNFSGGEEAVTVLSNTLKEVNLQDLVIHMNESVNTGTLNRVMTALLDIQFTLAREIDKR